MKLKKTSVPADDGKEIFTRHWLAENASPAAILLIVHGMGEHSGRYKRFAEFLAERNIAVFGYDHRGHGQTSPEPDQKGIINAEDRFHRMVQDIGWMREKLRTIYPDLPQFVFAHSMGSFLMQRHLQLTTDYAPAGVIYSGTSGGVSPLLPLGVILSSVISLLKGQNYRSELLRNMIFKPYNNAFKPTRTRHDWISSDPKEVDRYVADPDCGFTPTSSFLNHFFKGLGKTQKHKPFSGPLSYPVLIIAGKEDPISNLTDGITKLQKKLSESGISRLDTKVYEGGRHEMLSERNRREVMGDIGNWIDQTLKLL